MEKLYSDSLLYLFINIYIYCFISTMHPRCLQSCPHIPTRCSKCIVGFASCRRSSKPSWAQRWLETNEITNSYCMAHVAPIFWVFDADKLLARGLRKASASRAFAPEREADSTQLQQTWDLAKGTTLLTFLESTQESDIQIHWKPTLKNNQK